MPVITSFVFHLVLYGFRLGTSVEVSVRHIAAPIVADSPRTFHVSLQHASSDHERCFKTCLGSKILL